MTLTADPRIIDAETRRKLRREGWSRRGPLMPALLFTIIVTQLPFIAALVFSFRKWNANHPEMSGWSFANYRRVFADPSMVSAIWNTIELTVVVVLVSLVLGLGIALLLNREFAGRHVVRTFMITPFLIVPVAAALFWKFGMFDTNTGFLNGFMTMVKRLFSPGASATTVDFLGQHPMLSVQVELIWQWVPFMTLILLSGLQSRPADMLEAASIDGASSWQLFVYMTMPHMRQYIELAGLLGGIYILQNFDSVFALTPQNISTENLPNLIYQTINSQNDYGLASAQGVVIVVGSLVLATFALRTVLGLFKEEAGR